MSTMPPVKAVQGAGGEPTTRVDTAHSTIPASDLRNNLNDARGNPPPLALLKAIAGYDPQSSAQQLRGQALELATLLRDKQRLLEQRESELNARAALLESDLRAARLHRFHDEPARVPATEPMASPKAPPQPKSKSKPTLTPAPPLTPADEPADHDGPNRAERPAPIDPSPPPADLAPDLDDLAGDASHSVPFASGVPSDPVSVAGWVGTEVDAMAADPREGRSASSASTPARTTLLAATEFNEQLEHLEQQRQQLRRREEKLERRQRHVEQMHDEVTQLHREALELRLASEQVWNDLMQEHPHEELSQAMSAIRGKLADHYRLASDTLARRKDELHELRSDLNMQEQRLRQQRRDLQMWADRRYDEIESRLAKIILRERELDQMEGDFQRQSIQWQQQRNAYRQEIEQLSWQLHERSAG